MATYLVNFHGRRTGAIGISYRISAHVTASSGATSDDVLMATYDAGYENISEFRHTKVIDGPGLRQAQERMRNNAFAKLGKQARGAKR